jgi:antitoxin ParD1/3/4
MTTLTISLPENLKAFVDAEVKSRHLESASDYFAHLVVLEHLKQHREEIDGLLLEGLNSGPATPMTGRDWEDIRREVLGEQPRSAGKRAKRQSRK